MIENVEDAYIEDSDDDQNEWQSEANLYLALILTKKIKINKHT